TKTTVRLGRSRGFTRKGTILDAALGSGGDDRVLPCGRCRKCLRSGGRGRGILYRSQKNSHKKGRPDKFIRSRGGSRRSAAGVKQWIACARPRASCDRRFRSATARPAIPCNRRQP